MIGLCGVFFDAFVVALAICCLFLCLYPDFSPNFADFLRFFVFIALNWRILAISCSNLTCKLALRGFCGFYYVFLQKIYICKLSSTLIFARAIYALFLMHFLRFLHISGVILTNEQKLSFILVLSEGVAIGILSEKRGNSERIRILCE